MQAHLPPSISLLDLVLRDGSTVWSSTDGLLGGFQQSLGELAKLLGRFPRAASSSEEQFPSTVKLDEHTIQLNDSNEREFLCRASRLLDLDSSFTYRIYRQIFSASSSLSPSASLIATTISTFDDCFLVTRHPLTSFNDQSAMELMQHAYFAERQSSVRIFIRLLRIALQKDHWFNQEAVQILTIPSSKFSLANLMRTALDQLSHCPLQIPKSMPIAEKHVYFTQISREQTLLLELIFWSSQLASRFSVKLSGDHDEFVLRLVETIYETVFTQKSAAFMTSSDFISAQESLKTVASLSLIQCLRMDRFGQESFSPLPLPSLKPDTISKLLFTIEKFPTNDIYGGIVLLTGASIASFIFDGLQENRASDTMTRLFNQISGYIDAQGRKVELFKVLAQKAFQSGILHRLPSILRESRVFKSDHKTVYLESISSVLLAFLAQFDISSLQVDQVIVEILVSLMNLSDDLRAKLCEKDVVKNFWINSISLFPTSFQRFCDLTVCLLNNEKTGADGQRAILNMNQFVQDANHIDPKNVEHLGNGIIRTVRETNAATEFGRGDTFNMPTGTTGTYQTFPSGEALVVWNFQFSGWDLIVDLLAQAVELTPTELSNSTILTQNIQQSLKLIGASFGRYQSTAEQVFGERRETFETHYIPIVMDQVCSLFDKFARCSGGKLCLSLLVDCIKCMQKFVPIGDNRVWTFLKQANLVVVRDLQVGVGHLTRLRQTQEQSIGKYELTSEYLKLLLCIIEKLRLDVDNQSVSAEIGDGLTVARNYMTYFLRDICGSMPALRFADKTVKNDFMLTIQKVLLFAVGDMSPYLAALSTNPKTRESPLAKWGMAIGNPIWEAMSVGNGHSLRYILSSRVTWKHLNYSNKKTGMGCVLNGLKIVKGIILLQLISPQRSHSMVDKLLLETNGEATSFFEVITNFICLPWGTSVPIIASQLLAQYTMVASKLQETPVSLASHFDPNTMLPAFAKKFSPNTPVSVQVPLILFATQALRTQARLGAALAGINSKESFLKPLVDILCSNDTLVARPVLTNVILKFLETLWELPGPFKDSLNSVRENEQLFKVFGDIIFSFDNSMNEAQQCHLRVSKSRIYQILTMELFGLWNTPAKSKPGKPVQTLLDRLQREGHLEHGIKHFPRISVNLKEMDNIKNLGIDVETYKTFLWSTELDRSLQYGPSFAYHIPNVNESFVQQLEKLNLDWSTCDSEVTLFTAWSKFISIVIRCNYELLAPDFTELVLEQVEIQNINHPIICNINHELLWIYVLMAEHDHSKKILPAAQCFACFNRISDILAKMDLTEIIRGTLDKPQSYQALFYNALFTAVNCSLRNITKLSADEVNTHIGLLEKLLNIFKTCCIAIQDLPFDDFIFPRFGTNFILIIQSMTRADIFMKEWSVWLPIAERYDLIPKVLGFLSGRAGEPNNYTTISAILELLKCLSVIPELARLMVNAEIFELMRVFVGAITNYSADDGKIIFAYNPRTRERTAAHKQYCIVLQIFSSLVKVIGDEDKTIFNSFSLLESIMPQINQAFACGQNQQSITAGTLDELESCCRLYYNLAARYSEWKRRKSDIAFDYLRKSLILVRLLVDLIIHPNFFAQTIVAISKSEREESESEFTTKRLNQLLRILRCVLSTVYVFSYAWQPMQLKPDNWDMPQPIFMPSLEITPMSDSRVALGSLNALLSYCKDHLFEVATSKKSQSELDKKCLLDVLEITISLFVSQLMYSISWPQFDYRQRDQVRIEVGGELVAVLEAYEETLHRSGKDFQSLAKFISKIHGFVYSAVTGPH